MPDELKSNRARVVEATETGAADENDQPVKVNKFKNFFFHRKFGVFFAVLAVIMIAFAIWNHFASDKTADVRAIFAGPYEMTANDGREVCEALETAQGESAKSLSITDVTWYSKFDLENLSAAKASLVDATENQAELDRFRSELTKSDALLLFISPQVESQMKDALIPLSEIFGENGVPEASVDDPLAIRLGDTAFYEAFPAVNELPQNTRVCVRRASAAPAVGEDDAERAKALEADAMAIVRAIAAYKG